MRCGKEELLLFNVKANETGFRASCLFREYAQVEALAEVCGVTVTRISEQGLPLKLARYRWRFMLPCGILLVLFLLALSQSFLWTIEVRGNRDVSAEAIRMIMAEEGYSKMTFLPNKDLRMTCQNVMLKLPQLSFITINRYGSRLEVIVAERTLKTEIHSEEPCDIVAAQDGVVRSIEVYQGEKATGAGYAVSAGEVLAHGHYQTKKGQIMLVHADAKVIAEVFFEKTISIDLNEVAVEYTGEESEETSLYLFSAYAAFCTKKTECAL